MVSRGVLALGLLLACLPARAGFFCVTNGAELRDALTTAASNQENDLIQLVAGTYTVSSGAVAFGYYTSENFNVWVEGGYAALNGNPCGRWTNDPRLTVLDGQGARQVLRMLASGASQGNIVVRALTVRNGHATHNGGGAALGGNATYQGKVDVDRVLFDHNRSDTSGGALSISSPAGTVYVRDSEFWANGALIDATALEITAYRAPSSGNAVFVGNNTFVANQCSTGADPACAGTLRIGGDASAVVYNSVFAFTEEPHLYLDNDVISLHANAYLNTAGRAPAQSVGNLLVTNPDFVSPFTHDFRLLATSPLRDVGTAAFELGLWDNDGNDRVNGAQVDIGAYEYQEMTFTDGFESLQ